SVRAFSLSDIHHRPDELDCPWLRFGCASHDADMLHHPIGHQQPMLETQVRSVARRAIDHLLYEATVLRMDSVQHQIQSGLHRPVVSKDAISFLRPDDFAGGNVPAETARAT